MNESYGYSERCNTEGNYSHERVENVEGAILIERDMVLESTVTYGSSRGARKHHRR